MRALLNIILAVIGMTLLSSCATIYTEFQSAKTVGEGSSEITPTVSGVSYAFEEESGYAQTNVGIQYAYGITNRFDLRVRYEMIFPDGADGGFGDYNAIAIAPKISLVPDKLAYNMPFGFGFGEGISTENSYEVHPTLIFTQSLSDNAELNLSGKYIIPFESERENLVAFNVSFGAIGNSYIFRPSAGILINPGEDGVFWDLGLGVSIPF